MDNGGIHAILLLIKYHIDTNETKITSFCAAT